MADSAAPKPNLQAVRLMIDNAEDVVVPLQQPRQAQNSSTRSRVEKPAKTPPEDDRWPTSPAAGENGPPDDGAGEEAESDLPATCPVTPLGIEGDVFWYLDASRQLRALKGRDHSRLGVQTLFGAKNDLLYDFWPRKNSDGDTTGWRPERASESLMAACARRGVWNPFDRVRGPGGWVGDDGELVLHCGDDIMIGGVWKKPGFLGRHVYPAAIPGPRPAGHIDHTEGGGPAAELLTMLDTWSWRNGEVDARLLLGWIGCAMLGGALRWRPLAWITGDKSTGKSTLHEVLKYIFDRGLVSVSDASAAGVWQKLGHASSPVAIDELEAEEDNRRTQAVIKLARQAASGGVVLRGGADHTGAEFTVRSCFLFSSILIPPLLGQDRSRMAILELAPLRDTKPPLVKPGPLGELGAALRRRLVDTWPDLAGRIEQWRAALGTVGHKARGADQFGTLMAVADVLLHDTPPSADDLDQWADKLRPAGMAHGDDDAADHERCLYHLMTSIVDPYRSGGRHTVGEWIAKAAGLVNADPIEANRVLATYGLRVTDEEGKSKGALKFLAIANTHQGLAQLFAHTHWSTTPGAIGVWVQALRRLPGAMVPAQPVYFGGPIGRGTLIPVELAIPPLEDDARRELRDVQGGVGLGSEAAAPARPPAHTPTRSN